MSTRIEVGQSPYIEGWRVTLASGKAVIDHGFKGRVIENVEIIPSYALGKILFDEEDAGAVAAATGIDSGGFTTVADGKITAVKATLSALGVDGNTVGIYCREDDGGAFTDSDAAIDSATANDVDVLPAAPAQNDALYIGIDDILFNQFVNLVAGTDAVVTTNDLKYEYYNGSAWVDLTIIADTTVGLTDMSAGTKISWEIPSDWAEVAINTVTCFWFRIRENAALPVYGTVPLMSQGSLGVSAVIDVHVNGTTIFTTQADRLTFHDASPREALTVIQTTIEAPVFADAISITVDVDLVATGTAPQDLKVEIFYIYTEPATDQIEAFVITIVDGQAVITSNVLLSDAEVQVFLKGIP